MIKKFFFWIVLIGILVLGLGIIRLVSNAVYDRQSAQTNDTPAEMAQLTQTRVSQSQDKSKLIATANHLLAKNEPGYAKFYFARVSDLDPNLRDAAYGWGLALAKSHPNRLTQDEVKEINEALDRAEHVDPFYKPVLELKLALAKQSGDTATADLIQKRLDLLKK